MREQFPVLQRFAYLNAAASSPVAQVVADATIQQIRQSVQEGDIHFPEWLAFKETTRRKLAELWGSKPSEVALTPSTSMGFHIVAELFWRKGIREVLTLDAEFPSTTMPLLARGLKLRVVKARPDGTYRIEDLEGGEAIAVSAVQYGSGFTLDLRDLARHANARRVPLAVNVAHALGQMPVSCEGIDFLCGPSHKWMMGGYGVGVLFVREGWLEEYGLPWAGWLSSPDSLRWQNFPGSSWDGPVASGVQLRHDASALEAGSGPWSVFYGFAAGLDLIQSVGVAQIQAHNLELQRHLREGLQRRGFSPNAPLMSGICVTRVEGDPLDAVRALRKHQVVVTPRAGGIRISTHIYNNHDDVDRAFAAFDLLNLKPATST